MATRKYRLYECPYDSLPKYPRAVYSHYENGRMLILYAHRRLNDSWKLLTNEDIKKLSPHERQWYIRSRNEINAEYLRSPEAQEEAIERMQKLLEIYEKNLKQIQKSNAEVENAENKASSKDD